MVLGGVCFTTTDILYLMVLGDVLLYHRRLLMMVCVILFPLSTIFRDLHRLVQIQMKLVHTYKLPCILPFIVTYVSGCFSHTFPSRHPNLKMLKPTTALKNLSGLPH